MVVCTFTWCDILYLHGRMVFPRSPEFSWSPWESRRYWSIVWKGTVPGCRSKPRLPLLLGMLLSWLPLPRALSQPTLCVAYGSSLVHRWQCCFVLSRHWVVVRSASSALFHLYFSGSALPPGRVLPPGMVPPYVNPSHISLCVPPSPSLETSNCRLFYTHKVEP